MFNIDKQENKIYIGKEDNNSASGDHLIFYLDHVIYRTQFTLSNHEITFTNFGEGDQGILYKQIILKPE
jgi:hypothetical protein